MNWKLLDPESHQHWDDVESTQDIIKKSEYPPGSWITADRQNSGRGRKGKIWSAFGESRLIFSGKIKVPLENMVLPMISIFVGNALLRILRSHFPSESKSLSVKWPNDIFKNHKKVGGILIEGDIEGDHASVMIGIGCNLSSQEIPDDLKEIADSIQKELIAPEKIKNIYLDLVKTINSEMWNLLVPGPNNEGMIYAEKNSLLHYATLEFTHEGVFRKGTVQGYNTFGHLIVLTNDGFKIDLIDSPEDLKVVEYAKS
jgi:BirA family biotin operon repressor/biotin-[acetyl-CoA-carboxylase] ligase